MLVLTRKLEESLVINEDIVLTVLGVEGDKVKLGIDAPRHVKIHRKEVYEAIKSENKEAANVDPHALRSFLQFLDDKKEK